MFGDGGGIYPHAIGDVIIAVIWHGYVFTIEKLSFYTNKKKINKKTSSNNIWYQIIQPYFHE
jgi:hypothetical protein